MNRKFPIDGWLGTPSKSFFIEIQKGAENNRNCPKNNFIFFAHIMFGRDPPHKIPQNFLAKPGSSWFNQEVPG